MPESTLSCRHARLQITKVIGGGTALQRLDAVSGDFNCRGLRKMTQVPIPKYRQWTQRKAPALRDTCAARGQLASKPIF
jgi:hypothetical protein